MTLYVGTSGWQYRHWRGTFYRQQMPPKEWLDYYSERFRCAEVNNTFYRLPERPTFASWAESTPDDFVFVLKFSRFLTHIKRLKDAEEPVERFFDRCEPLGGKLGAVLLQLPANLRPELERLDDVLGLVPHGVRVALEFRHADWFTAEAYEVLRKHNAALCLADRGSRPIVPLERTADWGYVRLQEGTASPSPCYGRSALGSWAKRIERLWRKRDDVYVFFNNDTRACALRDARVFAQACKRAGVDVTRVPPREDVRLA